MREAARLLRVLQHGDSAFPSGGFAFSWGLETLKADGLVIDADRVAGFVRHQLAGRWAVQDRYFLHHAVAAGGDIAILAALDREIEAMTLASELREGSRRAGRTLLRAHAGLQTPGVATFQAAVRSGAALGHLPVAQAVAWTGAGLSPTEIETVSAYSLVAGLAQAAVRLSLLGALEAQVMVAAIGPRIVDLLAQAVPVRPHGFAPAAEIAVMRHETGDARLFAN
jgi:urease accessory protein